MFRPVVRETEHEIKTFSLGTVHDTCCYMIRVCVCVHVRCSVFLVTGPEYPSTIHQGVISFNGSTCFVLGCLMNSLMFNIPSLSNTNIAKVGTICA